MKNNKIRRIFTVNNQKFTVIGYGHGGDVDVYDENKKKYTVDSGDQFSPFTICNNIRTEILNMSAIPKSNPDPDIYVIKWNSESGDQGIVGYYTAKPTKQQIKKILKQKFPHESSYIYADAIKLSKETI